MKKVNSDDYVQGYYCLTGNYFQQADDQSTFDEYGTITGTIDRANEIVIESDENIEAEVIKRNFYHNMSDEAKEVISIVLNCPSELIGIITTPKKKIIKKDKLRHYLCRRWHSRMLVRLVLKEISQLIKLF